MGQTGEIVRKDGRLIQLLFIVALAAGGPGCVSDYYFAQTPTLSATIGGGGGSTGTTGVSGSSGPIDTGGGGGGGGGGTTPCTFTTTRAPILTTLPAGVTAADIAAICPGIGNDSECGTVIIIDARGVSLYFTGQGPFDGYDDTLVGVLNLNTTQVRSLDLASNVDIMGFDGDGIVGENILGTNQTVAGNPDDRTRYGGPNAYYTNISGDMTAGTVNFINPVAPNGGTTYFALENVLTSTSACIQSTAH